MTSEPDWKKRVAAATVRLTDGQGVVGGQGVLVPVGLVLTAAHCVECYESVEIPRDDNDPQTIQSKAGDTFILSVYAVEAVTDIAVLGALEEGDERDVKPFRLFCEATAPVAISTDDFYDGDSRVHILTHRKTWIEGTLTERMWPYGLAAAGYLEAIKRIESGTAGGPVVDDSGRLVGLVSRGRSHEKPDWAKNIPRPHRALPSWVWERIRGGKK